MAAQTPALIRAADNSGSTLAPSAPILDQPVYTASSGVQLHWLPSQEGTYPLSAYQVMRRSGSIAEFTQIAAVDKTQTAYLDSTGQAGDEYEVIAADDQSPANLSLSADPIRAVDTMSGNTATPALTDTPQTPEVTQAVTDQVQAPGNSAPSDQQALGTPLQLDKQLVDMQQQVQQSSGDALQQVTVSVTSQQADQASQALASGKDITAAKILHLYTDNQLNLLNHFDQLSSPSQRAAKDNCEARHSSLETSLLEMPESGQIFGIEALASCELIEQK